MSKVRLALLAALFSPLAVHAQSFESAAAANTGANVVPSGPIAAAPTAVLFDQGPLTNGLNGSTPISILSNVAPFNYCSLGASGTGAFRLADDFVVPAGQIWTVDTITVFGYQTGAAAASINNATLRILDGSPTGTPTALFGDTTTNRVGTTALSGAFRVASSTPTLTNRAIQAIPITVSPALVLQPGTYWIDFNAAGTVASGPFFPPVVPNIAAPAATGNALQFNATWAPLTQTVDPTLACTTTTAGPAQGLPFRVDGTSASAAPAVAAVGSSIVDFNRQLVTSVSTRTQTFSNTGAAPLTISALTAPAAPFSVTGGTCSAVPITLAAGASCTVIYTFSPVGEGQFSQTISVTSNGGNLSFVLRGQSLASIQLPTSTQLGTIALLGLLAGLGVFMLRRRA